MTHGDTASCDDVDAALTLQLRISGEYSVLLYALELGASATERFPLERIPIDTGDPIELRTADKGPVSQSRTVVDGDTDDAVEVWDTERPTADYPTGTVEYRIDADYQREDALTSSADPLGEAPAQQTDASARPDGESGDDTPVAADGPGFGVGTAVTGLGSLGYLLRRRLTTESNDGREIT